MIGPLSLRIAGDPDHLATARSFAGSIARVLGLDERHRQDIRLAVSELATVLIRSGVSEVRFVAEADDNKPLLRLQTNGSMPSIPSETSGLLTAIGNAVWSTEQPWVIRLGGAVGS
ncbi:MAG: ATP-binding protein [Acidimicrobiia bacterium]